MLYENFETLGVGSAGVLVVKGGMMSCVHVILARRLQRHPWKNSLYVLA